MGFVKADEKKSVETTITAEDSFTDKLHLNEGETCSISVQGDSFTGTWHIQRSFDGGVSWKDVTSEDDDKELSYDADEEQFIRGGVKTGNFTGTNVVIRIGKG